VVDNSKKDIYNYGVGGNKYLEFVITKDSVLDYPHNL